MKSYWTAFIFLVILGSFFRLYNFKERLIYGPEQAISLATSASNIDHFSLLGETNLIRKTSTGHIPFPDATYSYLILPLLLVFKFDPLPVTFLFALLNIGTGVLLSLILKKLFSKEISLYALFFFMFSAPMIHHSLFPWIVNPTPLLSVLTVYFGYLFYLNRKNYYYVITLGLLSGLGFGMQKMYVLYLVAVFSLVTYLSPKRIKSSIIFMVGAMMGNIPTIIFDLRHDFYHTKTFLQYFKESITGVISSPTTYYNYLYLYPVLFVAMAFVVAKLFKFSKVIFVSLCVLYIFLNLTSPFINFEHSTGMMKNITLSSLKEAASSIAENHPSAEFNIVTLWDFDTRAHTMRYLLTYMHRLTPEKVENYRDVETVYALAPTDYNIYEPRVWELQEFLPYKVSVVSEFAEGYKIFKLTK